MCSQVAGDPTLASRLLQIDLSSDVSIDKLLVDGTLSLGGNLGVVLNNGYTPSPGTEWRIGTAGSGVTGPFTSVTPGFTT